MNLLADEGQILRSWSVSAERAMELFMLPNCLRASRTMRFSIKRIIVMPCC